MPPKQDRPIRQDVCAGCEGTRKRFQRKLDDGLMGTISWLCVNVGNCWAAVNPEVVADVWMLLDEPVPVVEPENVEDITEE